MSTTLLEPVERAKDAPTTPTSLVQKLADVMQAVGRVPKHGHNSFHNYDYATEADIAEAIRSELAQRHVILLPAIIESRREPVGEKGNVLTLLKMEFTFLDGESGEQLMRPWMGAGTDKEDKGLYKAMTGGEKYFLLKTFLVPTGDDPERDDPARTKPTKAATPAPAASQPPSQGGDGRARDVPARSTGDPSGHPPPIGSVGQRIVKVEAATTQAGKPKWFVHFEDGVKASTVSASVAATAQQYEGSGERVQAELKDTQWGMNLVKLFAVKPPPAPFNDTDHTEPVMSDDIPF